MSDSRTVEQLSEGPLSTAVKAAQTMRRTQARAQFWCDRPTCKSWDDETLTCTHEKKAQKAFDQIMNALWPLSEAAND